VACNWRYGYINALYGFTHPSTVYRTVGKAAATLKL